MAHNPITERVAEELKAYSPFDVMDRDVLTALAGRTIIRYHEEGDVLFREGDEPLPHLFFIREGRVDLYLQGALADTCEPGDLAGVRSMLSGNAYVLEARVKSPSLIYLLPGDTFRQITKSNAGVSTFFAKGLAAGQVHIPEHQALFQESSAMESFRVPVPDRELIRCSPQSSIAEAARMMTKEKVGSIIITHHNGCPAGIITDTDLRTNVATGRVAPDAPVSTIMNSPVITARAETPYFEMLTLMMENKIHHICLTEDGTPNSRATGMVSERDLMTARSGHPALILKQIRRANDGRELGRLRLLSEKRLMEYLREGITAERCQRIITAVNDAIIQRCIQLALEQHPVPGDFSWISLGSNGRGEQLLRTDLDSALIIEEGTSPEDYIGMSSAAIAFLVESGYKPCPYDLMASNPRWCLTANAWMNQFDDWINTPDKEAVMQAAIFFDMRVINGLPDNPDELRSHILRELRRQEIFLQLLSQQAIHNPPPVGFFGRMILEEKEDHADTFDLKARVMAPLEDAARVLTLSAGRMDILNTSQRLRWLAQEEKQNAELFKSAARAFDWLVLFRAEQGLVNGSDGRYVDIHSLEKNQKRLLRNTFVPLRKLQELLSVRFQLGYIGS